MPILAERGYLIPAINTSTVSYTDCAEQLSMSIKRWHPGASVSIMTNDRCDWSVFDHVIELPYGDLGGYANDWQCFYASPYRQTIKLEADMLAAGPVDHWWTLFEKRDLVISQGARTIYNSTASSRFYRRLFDNNNLPDVYNAITYWRLSARAKEFFDLVRNIFENWSQWQTLLKFPDDEATTDVAYAMAAIIVGVSNVVLPAGYGPSIVHMKKHLQPIQGQDWTRELIWETTPLRIQTIAQHGLVHYHVKEWLL